MKLGIITAALFVCVACTPAQRAPIERDLSAALTDENLACLIGNHVPGVPSDIHDAIIAGCAIGPAATSAALTLLQLADAAHLGGAPDASTSVNGVKAAQELVSAIGGDR